MHSHARVQTHVYLGTCVDVRGQPQLPGLTYTSSEIVSYGAIYVSQSGWPASGGGVSCLSLPPRPRSAGILEAFCIRSDFCKLQGSELRSSDFGSERFTQ